LGIGDWGLGPIPNPQNKIINYLKKINKKKYFIYKFIIYINKYNL